MRNDFQMEVVKQIEKMSVRSECLKQGMWVSGAGAAGFIAFWIYGFYAGKGLIWAVLCILGLVSAAVCGVVMLWIREEVTKKMDVIEKQIGGKYGKHGRNARWCGQLVSLFGEDWLLKLIGLCATKDDSVIVDVSANKGLYDKVWAECLVKEGKKAQFLLFDRDVVEDHVEDSNVNGVSVKYLEERDAWDVAST